MSARPSFERVVLTGELALLRPQAPADARELYPLIDGREEILRWLVWDGPESRAELARLFERWVVTSDLGDDYYFVVVERASGTLAGSIGVRFSGGPGSTGNLGYWLGEPYQRRGLMTEAVGLLDWFAFRYAGADALCAWAFVGNEASRMVLERNGYRLTRTSAGRVRKDGRDVREWTFTLLRSDWERDHREPVDAEVRPAVPGPR